MTEAASVGSFTIDLPDSNAAIALSGAGQGTLQRLEALTGASVVMRGLQLEIRGRSAQLERAAALVELVRPIWQEGEVVSSVDLQAALVSFVEKYRADFEKIRPSFFEMAVGMAFEHFSNEKVDVAVIETGMGGRLDSTNVIVPVLSIITNIGLDHTQYLGTTYQDIAREKAGIIKEGVPVLIGEKQEETEAIFRDISEGKNAPIFFADSNQQIVESDISGPYQKKNINTVIKAIELLTEQFKIDNSHIKMGLRNTISSTGFMGRWQLLGSSPRIICDAGHNIEGTAIVQTELRSIACKKKHYVLGFVSDKDIGPVLKLYPKEATYYFCKANIPRGLNVDELLKLGKEHGLKGTGYSSVSEAFIAAKKNADSNDLIFIGGSTFVVAEVL